MSGIFSAGRVAVAVVVGAALALPATAMASWPLYGHDLANTRDAGARSGPSPAEAASLQQAWRFAAPKGDFTGTPVVAGGVVVAGTSLGTVYGLDAATGKVLWSRDAGAQINGSAAIDLDAPGGPTAFVPVASIGRPRLLALALGTGAQRWQAVLSRQTDSDVYGSPVFHDSTLYIGTSGPNNDESTARGTVVALDEATGRLRWRTFTVPPGHDGGAVWSTPAIDTRTGVLYVGTGNAYHAPAADTTDAILALDATDGRILGHFQTEADDVWEIDDPSGGPDHDFGASPNLLRGPGGRLLVGEGSKSGVYWAVDRRTLRPVWSAKVGPGSQVGGILASTAYDGVRVYGDDSVDGRIWSLQRDGATGWLSADGTPLDFSPVSVAHGVLYSAGSSGMLTARDAKSGTVLAKLPLDGPTFGGVAIAGHAVYVAVGTGPPPAPAPGVDTSQLDGSGAIVAYGDTAPASTFDGRCDIAGPVTFDPPLSTTAQDVTQTVRAKGTCTGTFVDREGRSHDLSGAPVAYASRSVAKGATCQSGINDGTGSLTFQAGTLRFTFTERRLLGSPTLQYTGARGGSALAAAGPSTSQDPVAALQACGGSGLRTFQLMGEFGTTPTLSG